MGTLSLDSIWVFWPLHHIQGQDRKYPYHSHLLSWFYFSLTMSPYWVPGLSTILNPTPDRSHCPTTVGWKKNPILSPLICLGTLLKNRWTTNVRIYFWTFNFCHWSIFIVPHYYFLLSWKQWCKRDSSKNVDVEGIKDSLGTAWSSHLHFSSGAESPYCRGKKWKNKRTTTAVTTTTPYPRNRPVRNHILKPLFSLFF